MSISSNLNKVLKELPEKVKLVAVSKTKSAEEIMEAYNAGQRIFGENKVQELIEKYQKLPKDIKWHLIGHLQTNKVKFIAPFVNLIHSVDSVKLLKTINKEAVKSNRVIDCLLQVSIAQEETKFGLDLEQVLELLRSEEFGFFKNIRITGLMGMATFTYETKVIQNEFRELADFFIKIKGNPDFGFLIPDFEVISMGMSSDYKIAIGEGSTMVRVGSLIFGERI